MNATQLLEHFERISEAPDAIRRLRRSILDLAMRGKLVEQDLRDEPAAELLDRIRAEKMRLVKEGKLKKTAMDSAKGGFNGPFSLPSSWIWGRLGEVADMGNQQPSTLGAHPARFADEGFVGRLRAIGHGPRSW